MEKVIDELRRLRRLSLLAGATILLSVHACSGASVTQSLQPEVELSLESATAGSADVAPTITRASEESAVLSGVISTPNPCYAFDAKIAADGRELTLTITARRQPGICVQMIGSFAYQARITGLAAGEYPTRMVCEYPDTGWEAKEYQLQLTIP